MADKKQKSSILERAKQVGSAGLEALGLPQKILMQRTAKLLGEEGGDTEKSAEQITEAVAKKLGIPEDSPYAGAAAKSAIQTALEVGYDPVNLLGVGLASKVLKGAKKSERLAGALKKLGRADKLPTMAQREEAVLSGRMRDIRAQEMADYQKRLRQQERFANLPEVDKSAAVEKQFRMEQKEVATKLKDAEARRFANELEAAERQMKLKPGKTEFPEVDTWSDLVEEQKARDVLNKRLAQEEAREQLQDMAKTNELMQQVRAQRAVDMDKTLPGVDIAKDKALEILKKKKK